jgi:hypothetical protein
MSFTKPFSKLKKGVVGMFKAAKPAAPPGKQALELQSMATAPVAAAPAGALPAPRRADGDSA